MEPTDSTQQEIYGTQLLNVHKAFPELTLHEVQDQFNTLTNDPRYARYMETRNRGNGATAST